MKRDTTHIRLLKEDKEYLQQLHLKDNTSLSLQDTMHKLLKAHKESPTKHKTATGFVTFYN